MSLRWIVITVLDEHISSGWNFIDFWQLKILSLTTVPANAGNVWSLKGRVKVVLCVWVIVVRLYALLDIFRRSYSLHNNLGHFLTSFSFSYCFYYFNCINLTGAVLSLSLRDYAFWNMFGFTFHSGVLLFVYYHCLRYGCDYQHGLILEDNQFSSEE